MECFELDSSIAVEQITGDTNQWSTLVGASLIEIGFQRRYGGHASVNSKKHGSAVLRAGAYGSPVLLFVPADDPF